MIKKLPQKYRAKWIKVFGKMCVICCIVMSLAILAASFMVGENVFEGTMFVLLWFILAVNMIICFIGFLGGKYIYLVASITMFVATFICTLIVTQDYNGWEYYFGIMVLTLYSFLGILVGSVVQVIFFIKRRNNSQGNKSSNRNKYVWIVMLIYIILLSTPLVLNIDSLEPVSNKYTNDNDNVY